MSCNAIKAKSVLWHICPVLLTYKVALIFWSSLIVLAVIALVYLWPEPYEFRVSQLTFDAWEVREGKDVRLDHYNTGYQRLHIFQRQRNISTLLMGGIGACLAHLVFSIVSHRDFTVPAIVTAFTFSLLGIVVAYYTLPPVVDPVYGKDAFVILPWWIDPLLPMILWAFLILICLYSFRWVLGRIKLRNWHETKLIQIN